MPLDAATMSALKERALWDDPLAHMLAHGWPLTKASYLAVATMAEAPDFPLDPELPRRSRTLRLGLGPPRNVYGWAF